MKISNDTLLDIIADASHLLHKKIKEAYNNGNLQGYLSSIDMLDLYPKEKNDIQFETLEDGKIIMFGDAKIKKHEIYGCLKEYGIDKSRIEMHLGYDELKRYPFKELRYDAKYRLILFGPVPHSVNGKEDNSSLITMIENTDGYAKLIRLTDEHQLKFTKTSLKRAISHEIETRYLVV